MAIKTDYRSVRRAYYALTVLISGQLKDNERVYSPELPFKSILKIRRIMGVMKPLTADLEELERELAGKYPDWDGTARSVPKELDAQLGELYDTECTVGSDVLTEQDFAHLDKVPVTLIGVLVDLGPFFVESPESAGDNVAKSTAPPPATVPAPSTNGDGQPETVAVG